MATVNSSRLSYSEQRIINNRAKRNKELLRNVVLFFVSLILFILLSVLLLSSKSVASDGSEEILYKYYTSVQIVAGDTLTSISNDYSSKGFKSNDEFIKEVMYINNLEEDSIIYAGQNLVIPYYDVYHS